MRGFSRIELGKLNPPGRGHVPYKGSRIRL
jgi:hypothetical protein